MAPRLAAAIGLLISGWLVATLLRIPSARLVRSALTRANKNATIAEAAHDSGMRSGFPKIVARVVFRVVSFLFAAASIELLGLTVVMCVLSQVAYYLPNVLAAIGVVVAGVVAGKLARCAMTAVTRCAGSARGEGAGQTTNMRLSRSAQRRLALLTASGPGSKITGVNVSSSLPALPRMAKRNDARLMIIDIGETPLDDLADFVFDESAPAMVSQLLELPS